MSFIKDKKGLLNLVFALTLLFLLFSKNIVRVFEPFYENVYFGGVNQMFESGLGAIYVGGITAILSVVMNKYIELTPLEKKIDPSSRWLPIPTVILLFIMTLTPILIISALCGWNLKIIYDLGERFDGIMLNNHLVSLAYTLCKGIVISFILKAFQSFFDLCIDLNTDKQKYIPFGGIALFLTFGLFEFFTKSTINFHVMYLFLNIYFGFILLLTNKSLPKTTVLVTIIYLL